MDFPETILTPRLNLQRLKFEDSVTFIKLLAKESARLENSFAGTLRLVNEDPAEYFRQCDQGWEGQTRYRFGLWKEQTLAGLVGLRSVDQTMSSAELFYFVSSELEGQGLAFEATDALVRRALEHELHNLWLRVLPSNPRSARLAERLGFEAAEVLNQNYTTLDGTIHDTQVYRRRL